MNIVEKTLSSFLNKTGSGWKSIVGISLMLLSMILLQAGVITQETHDQLYDWGQMIFGVGIIHKVVKNG